METQRQQKIAKLIQKDLGEIFLRDFRPVKSNVMITITKVNITSDLSYARIYLSIFGTNNKKALVEEVNSHNREIRRLLGNRERHQFRIIPELQFLEDDSLDYIENIDNLLNG